MSKFHSMSNSDKLRLSVFVIILAAIMTTIWHFTFIWWCKGSNFCLLLAIVTACGSFDLIRYFEEYFTATPNKPRNRIKTIANIVTKVLFLHTMLYTSSTFSAMDVIIKHPTFLIEFITYLVWFVLFSLTQSKLEQLIALKADEAKEE